VTKVHFEKALCPVLCPETPLSRVEQEIQEPLKSLVRWQR